MTDDERSQALPARAVEHLERGASRRAADAGQDARTGDERDVVLAAAEEKPWRVNDLLRAIGVAEWRTLSDDDRARRADGVRRTPPLRSDHAATPRRRRRIVRRAHRRLRPSCWRAPWRPSDAAADAARGTRMRAAASTGVHAVTRGGGAMRHPSDDRRAWMVVGARPFADAPEGLDGAERRGTARKVRRQACARLATDLPRERARAMATMQ